MKMRPLMDWRVGDSAVLCIDGWAGRREVPVKVCGHFGGRVRVTLNADVLLPGRRHGKAGEMITVPAYALARQE
jgi:hypothetical protein